MTTATYEERKSWNDVCRQNSTHTAQGDSKRFLIYWLVAVGLGAFAPNTRATTLNLKLHAYDTLVMLLVTFGIGDPTLDAIGVLESDSPTHGAVENARTVLPLNLPDDDPDIVTRLVGIWSRGLDRYSDSKTVALELASSKCGNQSVPIIVASVRELMEVGSDSAKQRAKQFFGRPIEAAAKRVSDVEPLLALAADVGCLRALTRISAPRTVKQPYFLKAISITDPLCGRSLQSLACFVDDNAIPRLRELAQQLYRESPTGNGFPIALRTLVELEDNETADWLEMLRHDDELSVEQLWTVETYLAKLTYQDSPEKLLSIIRTEKQNKPLLMWAVRRLLWLGTAPERIRDALTENSTADSNARELLFYLFPDAGKTFSPQTHWDGGSLMFSKDELLSVCAEFDPLALDPRAIAKYSTGALLTKERE